MNTYATGDEKYPPSSRLVMALMLLIEFMVWLIWRFQEG